MQQQNFEQQLTLTPEEASIYEGVRESLDGIYEQTMVAFLASLDIKYPGNNFSHSEIIAELRKINGEHKFWKLKGKGVNTWGVPSFDEQESEHEVRKQNATPF